jgi:hypothetical protein
MTAIKPEIGMGCTLHVGSDSYACTVTVVQGSDIEVQLDTATPAEGHNYYDSQKYTFTPNPSGDVKRFRYYGAWPGHERWREVVLSPKKRYVFAKRSSYRLKVGERNHFSDPSF